MTRTSRGAIVFLLKSPRLHEKNLCSLDSYGPWDVLTARASAASTMGEEARQGFLGALRVAVSDIGLT